MTFRMILAGAIAGLVASAVLVAAQSTKGTAAKTPTAADHKQWMDDAGDLEEDLRDAIAAKSGAKAAAAAAKLDAILVRTEHYWAAKHADDIAQLARSSQTLAKEIGTAAKAGKMPQASDAFTKLSAECNTCHDKHPEKR
jgi:hypothetical protein